MIEYDIIEYNMNAIQYIHFQGVGRNLALVACNLPLGARNLPLGACTLPLEVLAATVAWTLTSTRTRGHDDGSHTNAAK